MNETAQNDIRQQISIALEKPPAPVLEAIKVDGIKVPDHAVFSYGTKIYNPHAKPLPWHLYAHESEHCIQQDNNPDEWWSRWSKDTGFRLDQEARAYGIQYRAILEKVPDKNARLKALHLLAQELSGELYGKLTSYQHAKVLIEKYSKKHITVVS